MKIVIADDSRLFRERLKGLLMNFDYIEVVGEAVNGTEALKLISETNPDIAILDIRMPEMNGIEVLKKLRQTGSPLKVIILTNYPYSQYKIRCLAEGANYFIDKNQGIDELSEIIRNLSGQLKGV